MGENIQQESFEEKDFQHFKDRLRKETARLCQWFQNDGFVEPGRHVGMELENWLINPKGEGAAKNEAFLAELNDEHVVYELSQYNTEINAPCHELKGSFLGAIEADLSCLWQKMSLVAQKQNLRCLMIGTLPTLKPDMLTTAVMSNAPRYRVLNQQVMNLRQNRPIGFSLKGDRESLAANYDSVMLEASATSMQVHFQCPLNQLKDAYNASLLASPFSAALSANTPLLFGKELWHESRIPTFEQALALPGFHNLEGALINRVTLGNGYIRDSLMEIFLENLDGYPILMPVQMEEPIDAMRHVNLHNGSIWRWNRPVLQVGPKGPHLRIEHRVMASGPTIRDVVANVAFYVGFTQAYLEDPIPLPAFPALRHDFYEAARKGLDAEITAFGCKRRLKDHLLREALPRVGEGLKHLGVDQKAIQTYVWETLEPRVASSQNGAGYQLRYLEKHPSDLTGLVQAYHHHQQSGAPVHTWVI